MRRTAPRSPGVAYAVLSLVFVLLIAVVSLSSRTPPPPTIAEFAPQAVEHITDSSQDYGRGANGLGNGAATPTPPPVGGADAVNAIDVPRVRRCVGDPPRQIEDPQSPPCVPYWAGDNGGATWKGVTRDEIRIVKPEGASPIDQALLTFINRRFEFYGRKITLIYTNAAIFGDPDHEPAFAAAADEEHHAFGSTAFPAGSVYFRELAKRGLIGVLERSTFANADLAREAPHVWQYLMGADQIFANVGEWICKQLAGRPARWAGDPVLTSQQRKFSLVLSWELEPPGGVEINERPLTNELDRCNTKLATKFVGAGAKLTQQEIVNQVLQMRTAGTTTVICMCHEGTEGGLGQAASSNGYHPEWLFSTYIINDGNVFPRSFPPNQSAHRYGLRVQPKMVTIDRMPVYWAIKESNPSYSDPQNNTSLAWEGYAGWYHQLLLLASGIQMAGPRLTPKTFGEGLHKTAFPNPQDATMPGRVGFNSPADFAMTDDGAVIWWNNAAKGPFNDGGANCYLNGGQRFTKGQWPAGEPSLFTLLCDTGA